MPIDPRNYDVDELREVGLGEQQSPARDSVDGDRARRRGQRATRDPNVPAATAALQSTQFRELRELHAVTDGRKPYLETLPASFAAEVTIVEWLDFLLAKGGYRRALEVLDYYAQIGWLGERAVVGLREYLSGLNEPDYGSPFDPEDHRLSLVYLTRLASR